MGFETQEAIIREIKGLLNRMTPFEIEAWITDQIPHDLKAGVKGHTCKRVTGYDFL